MTMKSRSNESGIALIGTVVTMLVLLAVSGAAIALSVTDSRAAQSGRDHVAAFYLADGGLQRAKWEIGEGLDPDNDGIGTIADELATGNVNVTAEEISTDVYLLTSTGSTGIGTVTLVETLVLSWPVSAPAGAISVVGAVGEVEELFNSDTNLIIDGGADSPAVVMGDEDFHGEFVSQLDDGISDGYVTASDIAGGGLTGSDAIVHDSGAVADLETFYTDVHSHFSGLIASADTTSLPGSSNIVYGSAGSPVIKYFNSDSKLESGQDLSGYGTLIFENILEVESGATIDWHGDIVVLGDSSTDSKLIVDGEIDVEGNLAVMSQSNRDAKFELKTDGDVDVVGALTMMTNSADASTKLEWLVEGRLNVDGIVTAGAGIHQIEFKPGSDTFIHGMMQFAMTEGVDADKFTFKVESDLEIVRDVDLLLDGIETLGGVNGTVSASGSGGSGGADIFSFGWTIVHGSGE